MQKKFKRSFDSLAGIFEFTERFFASEPVDRSLHVTVDLIVEELFTNQVKYHADSPGDILLSLERRSDGVIGCLTDFDVEPFDVTRAPPADTSSPLERRRIGGLGLHLVRQMADTIEYDYDDRCSRIRFSKSPARRGG